MLEDLSKKLICIRFGYFETNHENYKRVMDICCGKDHIWDYHIHLSKHLHGEECYVEEFFDIEDGNVKKAKALNSQLIVINITDSYQDFVAQFNLKGFSDVMVTGVYKIKGHKTA